ncbi:hypothetical protein BXZ70DRAFT_911654, partial [Cristinia sonorae]
MSDRRKEIELKKAKLAEIRKAREDRQRDNERRQQEARTVGTSGARREQDVHDLVSSLIGTASPGRRAVSSNYDSPASSIPGTPVVSSSALPGPSSLLSGRASRQSDVPSERLSLGTTMVQSIDGGTDHVMDRIMTPRIVPDLIDVEQELFELPQRARVTYNKEIQTMVVEADSPAPLEEEIRERILRE